MRRTRRATALAACLAVLAPTAIGGCSFIFVRGPAKEAPGRYEPAGCTTSKGAPWVDFGVAAAQGYSVFYVLGQTDAHYDGSAVSREELAWILAGTTTLYALSAMYGFSAVSSCRGVRGQAVIPYEPAAPKQTRAERRSDEAAEEEAVQTRLREKAAADAKAAGEAAAHAPPTRRPHPDIGIRPSVVGPAGGTDGNSRSLLTRRPDGRRPLLKEERRRSPAANPVPKSEAERSG